MRLPSDVIVNVKREMAENTAYSSQGRLQARSADDLGEGLVNAATNRLYRSQHGSARPGQSTTVLQPGAVEDLLSLSEMVSSKDSLLLRCRALIQELHAELESERYLATHTL